MTFERSRTADFAGVSSPCVELSSTGGGRSGLTGWQCRRVRNYVEANVEKPLRVSDLAAEARISVGHFTRSFMIAFGVSPYSFITAQRVARAKALMLHTDYPLSSIALLCGMSDHAHFSRIFRRFEGLPPSAWRRTHRRSSSVTRTAA